MTASFDTLLERVEAGGRLSADDIRALAASPDILTLGMLADTLRARRHGTRATFLRVASCTFDRPLVDPVPPAASEVRIGGTPATLDRALAAIAAVREVAGGRTVSALSWPDLVTLAGTSRVQDVLARLRGAGLDAVAELPLDLVADVESAVRALGDVGFDQVRLSVARAPAAARTDLLIRAGELQDRLNAVRCLDPLPSTIETFRPTTGYEDVKMVAIARLAAPGIPSIQAHWLRYGPKLAQVALTFGADDVYGVSAADDAPEGRRRAPLEEIRRNIAAAGFEPVERDGRFTHLAA